MKKRKPVIVDKLALWASEKTQIRRLVIFNVSEELESPLGRNPEIQIELLHSQQGDPVFSSGPWHDEIQKIFPADITVLQSGQKIDLSKRSDYVTVYEKVD